MALYFQLQFIKVHCTVNVKSAIKCSLQNDRLSANRQKDLNLQTRKHYENPEARREAVKR